MATEGATFMSTGEESLAASPLGFRPQPDGLLGLTELRRARSRVWPLSRAAAWTAGRTPSRPGPGSGAMPFRTGDRRPTSTRAVNLTEMSTGEL